MFAGVRVHPYSKIRCLIPDEPGSIEAREIVPSCHDGCLNGTRRKSDFWKRLKPALLEQQQKATHCGCLYGFWDAFCPNQRSALNFSALLVRSFFKIGWFIFEELDFTGTLQRGPPWWLIARNDKTIWLVYCTTATGTYCSRPCFDMHGNRSRGCLYGLNRYLS